MITKQNKARRIKAFKFFTSLQNENPKKKTEFHFFFPRVQVATAEVARNSKYTSKEPLQMKKLISICTEL